MDIYYLKENIQDMNNWYHKLIYLVDRNAQFQSTIPFLESFTKVNVNKIVSEKLLGIPRQKYPMYVNDILVEALDDQDDTYILQHIDILFDSQLKINPVKLFEQLSKHYQLIVEWPGKYENNQLSYAEYGHPEYFLSDKFEGEIFIK